MSITGTPIFDSIRVMTIEIDTNKQTLVAEAAFLCKRTDQTHGWTRGEGMVWSKETREKAAELERLIEIDLAKVHFDSPNIPEAPEVETPGPGGVGEHLGDDVPSV
jgi:hypothetical protein